MVVLGDLVRVGGWPMMAEGGGSHSAGQFPFQVRFKGLLNISVAAAGLRRLLCRFCVFPLPVGAIPVVGSGWGLIPSGRAEASPAGGQGARGSGQMVGG